MTLALGVDTGGTYTDAVLIRDEKDVVASAKALTTRHDLALGVGAAVQAVLDASGVDPAEIALASLSTTLATNALVEGQGGRVALIYIGFRERDLETHGLREALKGDPCLLLRGGHTHAGSEVAALDEAALLQFLETHKGGVSGFAVAAQFAVRNPAHELRAMELIEAGHGTSRERLPSVVVEARRAETRDDRGSECATDRDDRPADHARRRAVARHGGDGASDGGARGRCAGECGAGPSDARSRPF